MRAISVKDGHGPASAMFIDDSIPDPVVRNDRILVQVKAFGLNRMDIWQRQANYPYKLPEETHGNIMGVEFAGVVLELGPECKHIHPFPRVPSNTSALKVHRGSSMWETRFLV
jgi:NADPH:quinone reductase-like Zn-dependent oxidoreductase